MNTLWENWAYYLRHGKVPGTKANSVQTASKAYALRKILKRGFSVFAKNHHFHIFFSLK